MQAAKLSGSDQGKRESVCERERERERGRGRGENEEKRGR